MDNAQRLLHPNLLHNSELVGLIKERQIDVNNLESLSRDELIDIFKAHIMPKPQRQSKTNLSTNGLTKEVKRIKLNRDHSSKCDVIEKMEVDSNLNVHKRNNQDNSEQKSKRQRIQWP